MATGFLGLVREIERQRGARVDLRAPSRGLRFTVSDAGAVTAHVAASGHRAMTPYVNGTRGALVVTGLSDTAPAYSVDGTHEAAWPVHPYALGQTYDWLGVPQRYGEALRTAHPSLLETVLNSSVQQRGDDERRMVRATDGQLRAVLSDKYHPLDNYDLMERAVLPLLAERDDLLVSSATMSDTRLYVQLTTPRVRGDVRVGDTVQAMVTIRNSEYGNGALAVERGVLRLVCLNGAVVGKVTRRTHVTAAAGGDGVVVDAARLQDDTRAARDKALWLTLRDGVADALSPASFAALLADQQRAAGTTIDARPAHVVENVGKAYGLSDDERASTLERLLSGRDLTQYGLAQSVTAQAHDAPADRAYDLQVVGGALLTLPAADWRALDRRN